MQETVIRIRSKKLEKMMKMQAMQHLTPSILLIQAGFEALHEIPLLGVFQILAAGCMLIITLQELKPGHHEEEGAVVRTADLFAAAMLLAEALHRAERGGHYLIYLYVLLSILMAVRAYFWQSLVTRNRLTLTADGFTFRRRFKSIRVPWSKVTSVDYQDSLIDVITRDGRQVVSLKDIDNRAEMVDAFRSYASQFVH